MEFTIPYSSTRELIENWLKLFQGMLKLGDRGKEVVVELVVRYLELKDKVLDEPTLWEVLWSHKERKGYRERLTMSTAQFTNLLTDLRKLGIILPHSGGYETLNPNLIPEPEFKVTFQRQ